MGRGALKVEKIIILREKGWGLARGDGIIYN